MKMKFFDLAKKLSRHSDHTQHKLGAVITRGNNLISCGFNKNKTSPRSPHKWGRLHAEIVALLNAKEDLMGCEIYVYRETRNGTLAMSRPCETCYAAIKEAGIKCIYYTDSNKYIEEFIL